MTKEKTLGYYDCNRGQYWTLNSRGEWIQMSESSLKRILRYEMYAKVTDKEVKEHRINLHLIALQREHDVCYAGPIAGYKAGIHTICGQRILVTAGPKLLKAEKGDWRQLRWFIESLLRESTPHFYGWLKSALKSLYNGPPFRPGQALALCGESDCGKSLLQNLLTEIFGGRSGKPYRYLTEKTTFNADLIQNEHLMLEDDVGAANNQERRRFGTQLKNMIVNETQSLHRKTRDALTVTPFTRLTITLNDDPEDMAVLPPIEGSLVDKFMILRAIKVIPPFEADDLEARATWRRGLSAEIPAFIWWLQRYRIPEKNKSVRYGVKGFQDESLLHMVDELSGERRLLALCDTINIWCVDKQPWVGTADELEEVLITKDRAGRAQKLLGFHNACARYLARMERKFAHRVSMKDDGRTAKKYTILPPDR